MAHRIEIVGAMYEANVVQIDDDDIARLLASLEAENTPWDGNEDIEEEITGDSIINGFTYDGNVPNFSVTIDGVDHPELFRQAIGESTVAINAEIAHEKAIEAETQDVATNAWSNLLNLDIPLTKDNRAASKPHSLVFERWSRRGSVHVETDGPIDIGELELFVDDDTLPGGIARSVINPSYGLCEFEFGDSSTDAVKVYIVKSTGETIDLETDGD